MAKTDIPLIDLHDLGEAIALLSRIPTHAAFSRGARAAWAWPLAGVVVAGLAGVAGWIALGLGLPAPMAAGAVLTAQIVLTGAMHEDGLADCADGFWGGFERARRLEIMKDSRIGAYGVLALGLSLGLRWSAITALLAAPGGAWLMAPLMAAAALSRAPMAVLMAALPNARGAGLAQGVGRPGRETALLAVGVALGAGFLAAGGAALAAAFWAALATIALAAVAKAKIGGQTGDVLGASQQVAEIAALAAFAASL